MGLSDRGLIRDGIRPDIVVFGLDTLDDVASWDKPTASPRGIETVIVNGVVTLDGSRNAGTALRHPC